MSSLQEQIEDRGLQIFDLVDQNPESIFSKAGFYQRMMAFSMRDEHFKVQMFRFVDVLASLRHSTDIVRHLGEYLPTCATARCRSSKPASKPPAFFRGSPRRSCAGTSLAWPGNSSPAAIRKT